MLAAGSAEAKAAVAQRRRPSVSNDGEAGEVRQPGGELGEVRRARRRQRADRGRDRQGLEHRARAGDDAAHLEREHLARPERLLPDLALALLVEGDDEDEQRGDAGHDRDRHQSDETLAQRHLSHDAVHE